MAKIQTAELDVRKLKPHPDKDCEYVFVENLAEGDVLRMVLTINGVSCGQEITFTVPKVKADERACYGVRGMPGNQAAVKGEGG